MRHPGYRGATSARMTALQFPTHMDARESWTDHERWAELEKWHRLVVAPGAQDEIDRRCRDGAIEQLVEERRRRFVYEERLEAIHAISDYARGPRPGA
jgi:hypothetical protein